MSRESPYLPFDTKINIIGGLVWKIWGGGCNNPPWLDVLQEIAWLRGVKVKFYADKQKKKKKNKKVNMSNRIL